MTFSLPSPSCLLKLPNRELKETRRRRKRERHMKMWLSAIILQLFKLIMLEKCVLTILELNWNQRLGNKMTKLSICHHMLTSSTQLQNRSFHVVERTRTSTKCQKMKNARAKRAKILFFIVKYANLWGFCRPNNFGIISPNCMVGCCVKCNLPQWPSSKFANIGNWVGVFVLDSVRKCPYLQIFYFYYWAKIFFNHKCEVFTNLMYAYCLLILF